MDGGSSRAGAATSPREAVAFRRDKPLAHPACWSPLTVRLTTWCSLALALLLPGLVSAAECAPGDPGFYGSSMSAWIDATAAAVEQRASEWKVRRLQIDVLPGEGVDPLKAKRVFTRRLEARLTERGQLLLGPGGADLRFALSRERGDFWAVGTLEGEGVPGGAAVVVSCPRDRELASLLGSRNRHVGQGRWSLTPLGPIHSDILDILLLDISDDGQDDIVLLSRTDLRALGYDPGGGRPFSIAGPAPLPAVGDWPAIVTGWLAPGAGPKAAVATSAGHALEWGGGRVTERSVSGQLAVPIRGVTVDVKDGGLALSVAEGGSSLSAEHLALGLPSPLRTLSPLPGRPGAWVFVDELGHVGVIGWDDALSSLPAGRVGDDMLAVDLDGDRLPELVTTGAGGPDAADSLSVHRLQPGLSSGVLFTETFEGSVVGIAAGDLDFDGLPDLVIAEEVSPGRAQLWHLERSR